MAHRLDVDDIILNFDPAKPHARFRAMGLPADILVESAALPTQVPWPAGAAPRPAPLAKAPPESADLSRFKGYDAVVVTWTAAEASAMATLFTPGYPLADWYEYRHDVESYAPLVTGAKAPFNDSRADMARYYHSLGLYFPCTIREKRVLLFKSGLHLDYDGPQCPVRKLMTEIAETVEPRIFITTGTGGGIGSDVKLGDVVVAGTVKFDCQHQFKNERWAKASFRTSAPPAGALAAMTPALMGVNSARIPGARATPQVFSAPGDAVVTTDVFAFDNSTNYYGSAEPRPRLRHGRCDGRRRPAIVQVLVLVFDPQRLGPADSEPESRHRRGEQAIGAHLRQVRRADDCGEPHRRLGDHRDERRRLGRAPACGNFTRLQARAAAARTEEVAAKHNTKGAFVMTKHETITHPKTAVSRFMLGRLPRAHDPRVPHLSALLAGKTLPPPPAQVDYTKGMPQTLGMMMNDTLGDCTCAAFYHALQVWSFNANASKHKSIETEPDGDVEKLYELACGYKPSQGGEGPGGNEQHVLKYLLTKGAPMGPNGQTVHKIDAFVEVDPRHVDDVKRAIHNCGVAYIGFNVPQYIVPATGQPPAVWDVENSNTNIVGGHAVVLAGYTASGARVISWGQYYTMTWAFFAKYVDETYAIANSTWINGGGKTPEDSLSPSSSSRCRR